MAFAKARTAKYPELTCYFEFIFSDAVALPAQYKNRDIKGQVSNAAALQGLVYTPYATLRYNRIAFLTA